MDKYLANPARLLPLVVSALALLGIWQQQPDATDWRIAYADPHRQADGETAGFHSQFVSSASDLFVHAASISALPDGSLLSAWFGGSREGGRDVNIYGAHYDPATARWGDDIILASRESTEKAVQRTIRKLGNPVVSQAPDGKLWLFYVSVSVGGWAGSALNASYSIDGGRTWTAPTRLITSPFANISTLVKGTPIYYRDGSIGLPVYHEFLGKFAELLRLDADARVLDKIRISHGKHSLQPVIVAASSGSAVALMRYAGAPPKRLLASPSDDGGKSWSTPHKTNIANPNSALAAVRLENGDILGVMNDLDDGRHQLSLLRSSDNGENWRLLQRLEGHGQGQLQPRETYTRQLEADFIDSAGPGARALWQEYSARLDKRVCSDDLCRFIYDYPYMIRSPNGDYHIVYTWNKSFIKHLRFNQAWLDTL